MNISISKVTIGDLNASHKRSSSERSNELKQFSDSNLSIRSSNSISGLEFSSSLNDLSKENCSNASSFNSRIQNYTRYRQATHSKGSFYSSLTQLNNKYSNYTHLKPSNSVNSIENTTSSSDNNLLGFSSSNQLNETNQQSLESLNEDLFSNIRNKFADNSNNTNIIKNQEVAKFKCSTPCGYGSGSNNLNKNVTKSEFIQEIIANNNEKQQVINERTFSNLREKIEFFDKNKNSQDSKQTAVSAIIKQLKLEDSSRKRSKASSLKQQNTSFTSKSQISTSSSLSSLSSSLSLSRSSIERSELAQKEAKELKKQAQALQKTDKQIK
jgi:hypothetical protein